mmetsp:Transcript_24471/g.70224  ORF Transcript_24471/g.70224 Transcript_24471/m.70224 type:complete len:437 (-) Transcript_24471:57-1367(-)
MAAASADEQQEVPRGLRAEQELDGEKLEVSGEVEPSVATPAELAAQEGAPPEVMAPAEASSEPLAVQADAASDSLATQVMHPVGSATPVNGSMDVDKPVELQKPAEPTEVAKPKTAYRLFQAEVRRQVMEEVGSGKLSKIAAAMAEKWKSLDESDKAKYREQAKELKTQYDQEIANGSVPATSARKKKAAARASRTKSKTSAARRGARRRTIKNLKRRASPKKPRGSYSIWLSDNRKEVRNRLVAEGMSEPTFEDIAKSAGKTWRALTQDQKAPYVERSRMLGTKYKDISRACKEYQKENVKVAKTKGKVAKKQAIPAKRRAAGKAAARASGKAKKQAEEEQTVAASKAETSPQKRAARPPRPTPKKSKQAPAEQTTYLDVGLVAEAEKAGFAGSLRRLAEREDMRPYPQRALLDALVASKGLLHPAKEALLARKA